jgi:hypothetical protein
VKSSINTTIQPISISKDAVEESLKDILKLSGDEKITFLEAGSYKSLKQYVTGDIKSHILFLNLRLN